MKNPVKAQATKHLQKVNTEEIRKANQHKPMKKGRIHWAPERGSSAQPTGATFPEVRTDGRHGIPIRGDQRSLGRPKSRGGGGGVNGEFERKRSALKDLTMRQRKKGAPWKIR